MTVGMMNSTFGSRLRLLFLMAALVCAAAPATWAQGDLGSEVRRLREDLNALQRQVYRGGPPPPGAAAPSPVDMSGDIAVRLSDRIQALEMQIQQLTGRSEELDYRTTQMQRRLDKLVEDIDFRLTTIERSTADRGAPPVAGTSPPAAAPGAAAAPVPAGGDPGPAASRTSDPNTPAKPEGLLGTMRVGPGGAVAGVTQSPNATMPTPAPARAPVRLQGNTPPEQYNYAFRLLNQGDYAESERAFAEFIRLHPDDPLAGNAQYWLAESFYVRKDYEKAASAFLAGYQKYPKGNKAPDSLVKLGKTLGDLNQKQEACAVFAQFNKEFPAAPAPLKNLAAAERTKAACR